MMILNPEIQRRAQSEVDQFVATEGRLPSFEDRASLPFVGCILKEVYRWVSFVSVVITFSDLSHRFGPPLPLGIFLSC